MTVSDNNENTKNSLVPKMTRIEFINELKTRLSSIPEAERNKSIQYYNEIIDDRVENGMDEITAIACLESPQLLAERILNEFGIFETPKSSLTLTTEPPKYSRNTNTNTNTQNTQKTQNNSSQSNKQTSYTQKTTLYVKSKMSGGTILLLILGFPIWFPLLMAFFAVAFAMYITIWSLVLSLFCVAVGCAVACVGCVLVSPFLIFRNGIIPSVFTAGVGLISGAIGITFWILSVSFTKAMWKFSKFSFAKIIGIFTTFLRK